jgi:sigma-B regulation protein RsbU (phosphoserine phosphatase)
MVPVGNNDEKLLKQLLEISRHLASMTDLERILNLIIDRAAKLLDVERATVFLYDSSTEELYIEAALEKLDLRFSTDVGIAGAAAREREIVMVNDAYSDDRAYRDVDLLTGFRTRNLLAGPLLDYDGQLVGVLELINKKARGFDSSYIYPFEILSAQAGIALQRARLIQNKLEKSKIEFELAIAGQIQRQLLPDEPKTIPGYKVKVYFCPSERVGGDYYDFIKLEDGSWTFLVGDATGHGIGPALISAETRALVRGVMSVNPDLRKVITTVNDLLVESIPEDKFITTFFGRLNPSTHRMEYASAGQSPILLHRGKTNEVKMLKTTSIPLGIFPGYEHQNSDQIDFFPGDTLSILTDGIPEYRNSGGEVFGFKRIEDCLRRCGEESLEIMLNTLINEMQAFAGDFPQQDDITVLMIRRL